MYVTKTSNLNLYKYLLPHTKCRRHSSAVNCRVVKQSTRTAANVHVQKSSLVPYLSDTMFPISAGKLRSLLDDKSK